MNRTLDGKIYSTQLGIFGSNDVMYGFLGIETNDLRHITFKVDAYTWYETLELGDTVMIEYVQLGETKILVARKISLIEKEQMRIDSISEPIETPA